MQTTQLESTDNFVLSPRTRRRTAIISGTLRFCGDVRRRSVRQLWQERAARPLPLRLVKISICLLGRSYLVNHVLHYVLGRSLHNVKYIDYGYEQIVYRKGPDVHKVIIDSIGCSRAEADALMAQLNEQYRKCRSVMGEIWQETSFRVMRAPLGMGYQVVAQQKFLNLEQAYEAFEDAFAAQRPRLLTSRQLRHLLERTTELYERYGMYPDICGLRNLVVVLMQGSLVPVYVDTLPVAGAKLDQFDPEKGATEKQLIVQALQTARKSLMAREARP